MTQIKRVLAIHDLCAFGRCSLTAAIPVISSMGIQVCPFPTAIFSNNFTYGSFEFSDFTDKMDRFMNQWDALGLHFDAVYSGFLANTRQMDIVEEAILRFVHNDGNAGLAVVDPAMGDDGKLYPIYTPDMVARMRQLVAKADLITPNYTEACLLLEEPCGPDVPAADVLEKMCRRLSEKGARQVVITSVPASQNEIKVACFDRHADRFVVRSTPRIPFSTCGTGDLFTSVATGALLRGDMLETAVELAMRFVSFAIEYTMQAGTDPRAGVLAEPCLYKLAPGHSNFQ